MEWLERLQFLAHTDEFYGNIRDCFDGKRRTTAGIAVQLGHDDTVKSKTVIKGLRHIDRFLTGHRIDNEQNFMRLNFSLDIAKLLHEGFIYLQAACRIDDNDIIGMALRISNG